MRVVSDSCDINVFDFLISSAEPRCSRWLVGIGPRNALVTVGVSYAVDYRPPEPAGYPFGSAEPTAPMSEPRVVTTEPMFVEAASHASRAARVPVEVRVPVDDPFLAYRRARECRDNAESSRRTHAEASNGVYLETTGGQSGWGYFALDPISRLQVNSSFAAVGEVKPSLSLAELAGLLDSETLVRDDCNVPYPCGAFGWLSYDVARELETLPDTTTDDRGLPRLQVGVFDRVAAWKEPRSTDETMLRVTACPRVGDDPTGAYKQGRERALALARAAITGEPTVEQPPVQADDVTFKSECSAEAFADRVRRVKKYIRDGDTFQANVSQRLRAPAVVHPVDAFAALRRVNPAPYSVLLEFPGVDLVSASPELLLKVESEAWSGRNPNDDSRDPSATRSTSGDAADSASGRRPLAGARLLTEPIAGTQPRGDTPAEDADLERDLLSDEKERAEHAMLVDLERNDLGKVSEYGSVHVPEYRRVDRYSAVMHLVSLVEGRLRDDHDLADAVGAVFPGGTITGAPKPRTMEIIDEVESTRRGPYTGSVGIFGFDGRATLNITIRTLVRDREEYFLRVGAGIVHDSEPEREYAETLDKGRALVTALSDALGDRGDLDVAGANQTETERDERKSTGADNEEIAD